MDDTEHVCPSCGNKAERARYCPNCGRRFVRTPEGPAPETSGEFGADELPAPTALKTNLVEGPWLTDGARRAARHPSTATGDLLEVFSRAAPRFRWQVKRHQLALRMLALARSDQWLERAELPGEVAAAFLRRYHGRETTQDAYARDLADWFVW